MHASLDDLFFLAKAAGTVYLYHLHVLADGLKSFRPGYTHGITWRAQLTNLMSGRVVGAGEAQLASADYR